MSRAETRAFMRDMQSVYQLLPNFIFCSRVRSDWARFDASKTGFTTPPPVPVPALQFSDVSNNSLFYTDIYTGLRNVVATRPQTERHLGTATAFHSGLSVGQNAYMHPRTISYFCSTEATPGLLEVRFDGVIDRAGQLEVTSAVTQTGDIPGDGTVPDGSANPAFISNPFLDTADFPGVDHVALSSDPNVIERILSTAVSLVDTL